MMADIFLSYSKSDHALALKLSAFLESEGWSVWWDKNLGAADLYRDEIMEQLAASRAVIAIWSLNSARSDWVRAEAGRAKADGKLIPVKTPDLTYADIPLPFGEMHTENVASIDLIRAAVVAQLAKPSGPQSPFEQITSTFKYQVLTWIGIVGSAITLFANLSGALYLADWASELVTHWREWNHIIWSWLFGLINISLPEELAPLFSFTTFALILVTGTNLSVRTRRNSAKPQIDTTSIKKVGHFVIGVLLYIPTVIIGSFLLLLAMAIVQFRFGIDVSQYALTDTLGWTFICIWSIGFPLIYLMYRIKQWSRILIASILFLLMGVCLLLIPVYTGPAIGGFLENTKFSLGNYLAVCVLFQILWMGVILFSPLQQLTRRLVFVLLGVLTLIMLSEISKLNLHQYL